MDSNTFFEYVPSDGIRLFTVAMLPSREGAYPTVVIRCLYVDWLETWTEKDICDLYEKENESWLKRGYAVVYQHCRGRGKDPISPIYRGRGAFLQEARRAFGQKSQQKMLRSGGRQALLCHGQQEIEALRHNGEGDLA